MARFVLPRRATIDSAQALFATDPFAAADDAVLEFAPETAEFEPVAVAMIGAWSGWCRRRGMRVRVAGDGGHVRPAGEAGLLRALGVEVGPYDFPSGHVLPLAQVRMRSDLADVMATTAAALGLKHDPETLAAVQYCISELTRNVLEHSGSPEGAFLCARRYSDSEPQRISLAVADCGRGIADHLARAHPEAGSGDDLVAIGLAMRPGVTGALPGMYGTPDNAGAGLFITRGIAKGTGGYFFLISGHAAYRLERGLGDEEQLALFADPYDEERFERWRLRSPWLGTVVAVEIRTDWIGDYESFFKWIFNQLPPRVPGVRRIRFS